jgi:hypothetical protein
MSYRPRHFPGSVRASYPRVSNRILTAGLLPPNVLDYTYANAPTLSDVEAAASEAISTEYLAQPKLWIGDEPEPVVEVPPLPGEKPVVYPVLFRDHLEDIGDITSESYFAEEDLRAADIPDAWHGKFAYSFDRYRGNRGNNAFQQNETLLKYPWIVRFLEQHEEPYMRFIDGRLQGDIYEFITPSTDYLDQFGPSWTNWNVTNKYFNLYSASGIYQTGGWGKGHFYLRLPQDEQEYCYYRDGKWRIPAALQGRYVYQMSLGTLQEYTGPDLQLHMITNHNVGDGQPAPAPSGNRGNRIWITRQHWFPGMRSTHMVLGMGIIQRRTNVLRYKTADGQYRVFPNIHSVPSGATSAPSYMRVAISRWFGNYVSGQWKNSANNHRLFYTRALKDATPPLGSAAGVFPYDTAQIGDDIGLSSRDFETLPPR